MSTLQKCVFTGKSFFHSFCESSVYPQLNLIRFYKNKINSVAPFHYNLEQELRYRVFFLAYRSKVRGLLINFNYSMHLPSLPLPNLQLNKTFKCEQSVFKIAFRFTCDTISKGISKSANNYILLVNFNYSYNCTTYHCQTCS